VSIAGELGGSDGGGRQPPANTAGVRQLVQPAARGGGGFRPGRRLRQGTMGLQRFRAYLRDRCPPGDEYHLTYLLGFAWRRALGQLLVACTPLAHSGTGMRRALQARNMALAHCTASTLAVAVQDDLRTLPAAPVQIAYQFGRRALFRRFRTRVRGTPNKQDVGYISRYVESTLTGHWSYWLSHFRAILPHPSQSHRSSSASISVQVRLVSNCTLSQGFESKLQI